MGNTPTILEGGQGHGQGDAHATSRDDRGRSVSNDGAQGEKLLTKCEVAQLCRVETRTVDRWVAAGKITCYRTPGGRLLFRERDVLMTADRAGARPSEWPVMQRAIRP